MKYNILICDDDIDVLNALEIYLLQERYSVTKAVNGMEAFEISAKNNIHLILLDIMMPILDGIQAAVKIRQSNNVPIIFLSAKSEETDRILGLNMGADDYITKPFNPVELLARIKAALRRYTHLGGINGNIIDINNSHIIQTGGLCIDTLKKLVVVNDKKVSLTPIEYNIMHLLISNLDRVFSSEQIYESVWNEPAFYVSKTVSVHIRNIREKIEINPKEPQYLKVVYGLGYKIVRCN